MLAGGSADGMSAKAVATLHALLREPPEGDEGECLLVLGTTSSARTACGALDGLFERTVIVPPLRYGEEIAAVLRGIGWSDDGAKAGGEVVVGSTKQLPIKVLLEIAERASIDDVAEFTDCFVEWREMQEAAGRALSCGI